MAGKGARLGGIYVDVRASSGKLKGDLRGAKTQATTAAQKMQQKFDSINWRAAGIATVAFGGAVALAMSKAVKAASDLQEVTSKFETVFKDQMKIAQRYERVLKSSFAMSTREARQFLSSIQDLLVPMGMNSQAAAKMSGEVVKLAADLGSFNNLPTSRVIDDMQSALVGNYETMKKYGVVLNATVVQQKALDMGLAATKAGLTAGQKAQAAYTLMVEGSKAAIGDMGRTMGGYANQVKQLKAHWEDFLGNVGVPLMEKLSEILVAFNKWYAANQKLIETNVKEWIDKIVTGAETLWGVLQRDKAMFEVGLIGLLFFGKKGAAIGAGVGHMITWINNLTTAIGLAKDGIISWGAIATANFNELAELVEKNTGKVVVYTGKIKGQGEASVIASNQAVEGAKRQLAAVGLTAEEAAKKEEAYTNKFKAELKKRQGAIADLYSDLRFKATGYYEWMKTQIDIDYNAHLDAGINKNLAEEARVDALKELHGDLTEWLKRENEGRVDNWQLMNTGMENATEASVEKHKGFWEDLEDKMGDGSRNSNGFINRMVQAWGRGEDLKVSISEMAKNSLIEKAGSLVQALWDKMIEKLAAMIGAWIGLGSAESGAEGKSWQERVGRAVGFAGSVLGLVAASKSAGSQFKATGGWIGSHPGGGLINAGSGLADDVFLGKTGNVNHWGMGGEFVVNKRSSQMFSGLLERINSNKFYAGGGPLDGKAWGGDPEKKELVVDRLMASGIRTWWETFRKEKNIYSAIVQTIAHLSGVVGGSFVGKLVGQNIGWAEGGTLQSPPTGGGGSQQEEDFGSWLKKFFGGIWGNFSSFNNKMNKLMGRLPWPDLLADIANPLATVYTWIRELLGRDILEEIFDPARKIVRLAIERLSEPGNMNFEDLLPFSGVLKDNYEDKPFDHMDLLRQRYRDYIKPKPAPPGPGGREGFMGSFQTGGMLPHDGYYKGHEGEGVLSRRGIEALGSLNNGGSLGPVHVHVHVGGEEFSSYIANVADGVRVDAIKLGAGERELY